jgi:hypothetical protein
MAKELSLIFERKPEQWGLRGNPYLWDEMRDLFGGASLDISTRDLADQICECYENAVGEPLKYGSKVFVERFAHGGMSSGYVSGEFWICIGIPFLIDNFRKIKQDMFLKNKCISLWNCKFDVIYFSWKLLQFFDCDEHVLDI